MEENAQTGDLRQGALHHPVHHRVVNLPGFEFTFKIFERKADHRKRVGDFMGENRHPMVVQRGRTKRELWELEQGPRRRPRGRRRL